MVRAHVEVSAKHGDVYVPVLVDLDTCDRLAGRKVSIGSHGYPQVWDGSTVRTLHAWVAGTAGQGRRVLVDHRNRNVLDCRRSNLRVIDPSVSNANRGPSDASTVGAYRVRSGRWMARVQWRTVPTYLGTYDTQAEALMAVAAFRRTHPESVSPRRLETAS
jgi:hypothetical protein